MRRRVDQKLGRPKVVGTLLSRGMALFQKGFALLQKGMALHQEGMALLQKGMVLHQKGMALV